MAPTHIAYETCGFLGFFRKKFDLSSVCGPGTEFRDGRCEILYSEPGDESDRFSDMTFEHIINGSVNVSLPMKEFVDLHNKVQIQQH